jgi:hypothetical protein
MVPLNIGVGAGKKCITLLKNDRRKGSGDNNNGIISHRYQKRAGAWVRAAIKRRTRKGSNCFFIRLRLKKYKYKNT